MILYLNTEADQQRTKPGPCFHRLDEHTLAQWELVAAAGDLSDCSERPTAMPSIQTVHQYR